MAERKKPAKIHDNGHRPKRLKAPQKKIFEELEAKATSSLKILKAAEEKQNIERLVFNQTYAVDRMKKLAL